VIAMKAALFAKIVTTVILVTVVSGVVMLPTVSAAQSLRDAVKYNEEANKLSGQGRYAEAEQLYKRALAIYDLAKDIDPALFQPVIAVALNNLAGVYKAQKRYTEAELLYKRSLAIKE